MAFPLLAQISLIGSQVLADRGYDSHPLPLMHVRHDIDFSGLAWSIYFCFRSVARPYSAHNSRNQDPLPQPTGRR